MSQTSNLASDPTLPSPSLGPIAGCVVGEAAAAPGVDATKVAEPKKGSRRPKKYHTTGEDEKKAFVEFVILKAVSIRKVPF